MQATSTGFKRKPAKRILSPVPPWRILPFPPTPRHCPAKNRIPVSGTPNTAVFTSRTSSGRRISGNEPDKPAPLSVAMFPGKCAISIPCSVPPETGRTTGRETAYTGYRPYPLFPFSSPYSFLLLYPKPAVTYHVGISSIPLARFAPCRFPSAASPLSCPSFRVWHPVPYRPARPVMLRQ